MDYKEDIIQQCLNKNNPNNIKTYAQIGEPYGLDSEAVRSLFRRWKKKNNINVNNKIVIDDKMPENDLFNKIKIERQN